MRTTVDLPPDVHARAKSIARDLDLTLSAAVTLLVRRGLDGSGGRSLGADARGWPVVSAGRPITSADVRALDDDE